MELNDAHVSDKVLTKTPSVGFITASQPDAEFGLLAGRTLPRDFLELSRSSLVLESERHRGSMHGRVRLNEWQKNTVEPKYQNHKPLSGYCQEMAKISLIYESDYNQNLAMLKSIKQCENRKLKYEQGTCLQEMLEWKSEERKTSESVDVWGKFCHFYPEPTSLLKPTLLQYDEPISDKFKLSTKDRESSFPCGPGWNFNVLLIRSEPDWKFPFLVPLPGYREDQAACRSVESDVSRNGYLHRHSGKLKNDQPRSGLTDESKEDIATAGSMSLFEYFSGEPLATWSAKHLFLQLIGVMTAYNLFLEGPRVLGSAEMHIAHS